MAIFATSLRAKPPVDVPVARGQRGQDVWVYLTRSLFNYTIATVDKYQPLHKGVARKTSLRAQISVDAPVARGQRERTQRASHADRHHGQVRVPVCVRA